jgi:predicted nucleotidyltransferase
MRPPAVDGTADLPAPVATALTAFVSSATASLDSDLRSIVLFGSGAENRLRPTSDVNLAAILRGCGRSS